MTQGKKIGYIRVSSIDQNPGRQLEGIELDRTYIEKASGKTTERPKLKEMIDYVRDGDTIYVHSMDRLARNLIDLRQIVNLLTDQQVEICFVKENLTFNGEDSPMSILLLTMMGAFAEFERSIIRERQQEGIALAKKKGLYKGRKKVLSDEQVYAIQVRVLNGEKKSDIARDMQISRGTLYKYLEREKLVSRPKVT